MIKGLWFAVVLLLFANVITYNNFFEIAKENRDLRDELHITEMAMEEAEDWFYESEDTRIEYAELLSEIFEVDIENATKYTKTVNSSAYSANERQTDSTPHIDSNNKPVMTGSIAMSRDLEATGLYELNQIVYAKGHGVFRITGRMNKRFNNKIDFLAGNEKAAWMYGVDPDVELIAFRPKS